MKKLLLASALLIFPAQSALGNFMASAMTYETDFQNFAWYEKIFLKLAGYEALNWDEVTIKTDFTENISAVTIWPEDDQEKPFFHIFSTEEKTVGWLNLKNKEYFSKGAAEGLIRLWNYLYENSADELEIKSPKIFADDKSPMRLKLSKKKNGDKMIIDLRILKSDGEQNASAEIIIDCSGAEPLLEKISAEDRRGHKVILSLKK